jgi:hypothetical protein
MPLELTQHARDMLVARGISETWVERAVTDPEAVEKDEQTQALNTACNAYRNTATGC